MKTIIKTFLITAILVSGATAVKLLAADATIEKMKGEITLFRKGIETGEIVSPGAVIGIGDKLKSSPGSWAKINFSNGHVARIGANSSLLIKEMGDTTSLKMFQGAIKSKVSKLSKDQAYFVTTPQSVASVRGTTFKVKIQKIDGKLMTRIFVSEGEVSAKELVTGEIVVVNQGEFTSVEKGAEPAAPDLIENTTDTNDGTGDDNLAGEDAGDNDSTTSEDEEAAGEEATDEEATDEEATDEEATDEEATDEEAAAEEETSNDASAEEMAEITTDLKSELKEAVDAIQVDVVSARDVVEDQQQNDTATGRTMRDVHGNLVRIEQYLLRPSNDTVQLVNITKRDNYKYGGVMNITATSGSRIDSMDQKITFNKDLPEKISGWPKFFQDIDDSGEDFYPTEIRIELSNKTDKIITTIGYDEVADEMEEPVVKVVSGKDGNTWIVDQDNTVPLAAGDEGEGAAWPDFEDEDDIDKLAVWAISPGMRVFLDNDGDNIYDDGETAKIVRVGAEGWLINGEGNPLSVDTFEGADGVDPFELIKEIALETSMIMRHTFSEGFLQSEPVTADEYTEALKEFNKGTNLMSTNIDLVVTPDIIVATIEEIASEIDFNNLDFGDDEGGDNTSSDYNPDGYTP